ncbi:MAG TPA: L-histidine N(alpha)-methyltransferase [Actinobacteria bacterium]|nr:L-histidine N(alpha)-methyltransferase [Actinomycetota bacterium]
MGFVLRRVTGRVDRRTELAADVRRGFTAVPKWLPSKWFYDDRGSELFERITELPEYYLTRAETELLERHAGEILAATRPTELVELGSGSSTKTRLLLEALRRLGTGRRYAALDVSEGALEGAGAALAADHPWLEVEGFVGDLRHDLRRVPRRGRRLVVFLGSTIGNLSPDERPEFFSAIRAGLEPDDAFLLGVDLVKEVATMIAAYDDAEGVSAEFNRNVLRVVNRELDGDLPVEDFAHVTRWVPEVSAMAQSLRATRPIRARIAALDLEVTFAEGEELHTEWSCKFTREGLGAELAEAGLHVAGWWEDGCGGFALALARPAG